MFGCLFMCKLVVASVPVCTRNEENEWYFAYYALNKMLFSRILCHFKFAICQFLASSLCVLYVHYEAELYDSGRSNVSVIGPSSEARSYWGHRTRYCFYCHRKSPVALPSVAFALFGIPMSVALRCTYKHDAPSYKLWIIIYIGLGKFTPGCTFPSRSTQAYTGSFMFPFLLSRSEVPYNSPFSKIRVYRP
jgi:hypothetical protein